MDTYAQAQATTQAGTVRQALAVEEPMIAVGKAPDPRPWHSLSHAPAANAARFGELAHVAALCHVRAVEPGRADPGRLDWFRSAVLPDGGQRVRICRCARSTPTEAVELDSGTSVLQRNPADLRGLAALGELARVDPAVSWPAARQAVLRAFWRALKKDDPA